MSDLATLNAQNDQALSEIEAKVKESALTSERQPLRDLLAAYPADSNFAKGIESLDYKEMRVVRGDGNCYYRAFLYQLCELILQDDGGKLGKSILTWLKETSWPGVLKAGYDEMMLETFYDTVVDLLERVVDGKVSLDELHTEMNEETGTSDYCTWYLRVVTAAHLKQDPERFLPFLPEGFYDIAQFCQKEVEPMGRECEQVQVLALAEAVGVQVQIAYLDGRDSQVQQHTFGPEDCPVTLTLLYRPGHYDILYRA